MLKKSTLPRWLNYITHSHPKTIDLGLERAKTVANSLQLLSFNCPIIVVGGTNGKGSCVATMEAILTEEGYSVGAYFSPHLARYNERIRIKGKMVKNHSLCEAFAAIDSAKANISLTYFEWSTLAALWLFKKATLDAIILEVGLGGRLDAVNILEPSISVITSIDYDHTEWLGDNLESIGREKAGIFRPQKPVVYGESNPPKSIDEKIAALEAPFYRQGVDFGYRIEGNQWRFWHKNTTSNLLPIPRLILQNVTTALMALTLLQEKLPLSAESIIKGLKKVFLPGRFQEIAQNPTVILDVAHNPAGFRQLSEKLDKMPIAGKTYAVTGMLTDKDHKKSFAALLPLIDIWHVATLTCERGASASQLVNTLSSLGAKTAYAFESILKAYEAALNVANINDRIIVFGSFYAVTPILRALK